MIRRIDAVRSLLENHKIDALFITSQSNVTYLTGFTGLSPDEREAFFLLTKKVAFLFTFPTYAGLVPPDSPWETRIITPEHRLRDYIGEIVTAEHIQTIGFEKQNMTVAELESLTNTVKVAWSAIENIIEDCRVRKDETEIAMIKKAAVITDEAFRFILPKIKPGVTEKDIALEIEFFLKKNADGIAFSPIVAFNEHAAIPHHLPADSCQLVAGSLILLDFGAKVGGYCADMTRVVFLGTPADEQAKTYSAVLDAQEKALDLLRKQMEAGTANGEEIDLAARDTIKKTGLPDYPHGLGHGVGLAIHEAPRLRHGFPAQIVPDMVVTVEPGVYLPGKYGVRIEDLVLLRKDGIEILSQSPKTITIL